MLLHCQITWTVVIPCILLQYRIVQNFGRINFWWLVARHAIGREKFAKSSTTGLSRIVYIVTFKNLAGKILAGLDKSAKIFHHQNFALYDISFITLILFLTDD